MKWLSKKNRNEDISYWQTIADILSALFLLILLISLLLILYILRYPEDTEPDPDPGDHEFITDSLPGDESGDRDHDDGGAYGERHVVHSDGGEGGGGSGGGNGRTGEGDFTYPEPGWGDYTGTEKAAVYVRLLDAGTGKTIREPDVTFTLYDRERKQELLTVYYPEKTTFKEYVTTEQGTFFLPEKIRLGTHLLREETEPFGYDAAADTEFVIEESHDWDEPYILDIPLFPSRNVIRLLQTDAATGALLKGGLYRITAAEDIITADGTLRYRAGENVGEIVCDERGLGVSEELYLGEYLVTQVLPPECYAVSPQTVTAKVEKKNGASLPEPHLYACEQTVFSLVLTDELYPDEKIREVVFTLEKNGDALKTSLMTDANGTIRLTGLTPDTVYTLRQQTTSSFYTMPEEEISFTVDAQGLIEGSPEKKLTLTNRMLRATVLIRDAIFRSPISDRAVSLFDGNGECVAQWTSSGNPHEVNGLAAGEYTLEMPGTADRMRITVTEQAKVQAFEFRVMTKGGIAGLIAAGLAVLGGAVFAAARMGKKRRKKQV